MNIDIQTKKSTPISEITKTWRRSIFEMAAAAILLIEVNGVKWAITTRFL
jgi:hypothetical protein